MDKKTPYLTCDQISELSDERLAHIIKCGESLDWNALLGDEAQDELDDYISMLYDERYNRLLQLSS